MNYSWFTNVVFHLFENYTVCISIKALFLFFSKLKIISSERVSIIYLGTSKFFSRIESTMEMMSDIWSASQEAVPRSSQLVEILLSATYWKVVQPLEVTDTDCDKPHIGILAWGGITDWNEGFKINGGRCHLPISLLTTYFTLDCSKRKQAVVRIFSCISGFNC